MKWNNFKRLTSEPTHRINIPVRQLGLKTGQVVIVRRVKRTRIEVLYDN